LSDASASERLANSTAFSAPPSNGQPGPALGPPGTEVYWFYDLISEVLAGSGHKKAYGTGLVVIGGELRNYAPGGTCRPLSTWKIVLFPARVYPTRPLLTGALLRR